MNQHTTFDASSADDAPEGQALATLEQIDDICAGRDEAIRLWLKLYDSFHEQTQAIGSASIAGLVPYLSSGDFRGGDEGELTKWFLASGQRDKWIDSGRDRRQEKVSARDEFEAELTKLLDRRCWTVMMERLGFDRLLDRQAHEEFKEGLLGTPPAFTVENCQSTFGSIWASRRDIYLRGIANVFMSMDRSFRSHDAFEIGTRLIIERAFSIDFSWWDRRERRDAIADVERIFRELEGLPPLPYHQQVPELLSKRKREESSFRHEDDYFKIDVFKNGNVHFWFKRKDLLARVNELLLEYYKPVEGDVDENGPSYESGPLFHASPAKNYGFFPSPQPVVEAVMNRAEMPGREDCAGWVRENWTPLSVLEPSAGTGALADAARAMGHDVTCIEIQPELAAGLRGKGHKTFELDFLRCEPADIGTFDRIVMNPPFDRGRDCDHVRHAYRFLKPGGKLIAVMSARAELAKDKRHAALHDLVKQTCGRWGNPNQCWQDLPDRSFAECGTNVNTVTLRLQKPMP